MMFQRGVIVGLVLSAVCRVAVAQAEPAARYERPLLIEQSGPQRVAVDVPLLSGAESSLADLRFYDGAGAEVPYLVMLPTTVEPEWRAVPFRPIAGDAAHGGIELDLGAPFLVNAVRMEGIPPPFLKRCRLEGSGDRERWTVLVEEQSVFDLPTEALQWTTLEFAAGEFRYLRISWDDTAGARLPLPARALVQVPMLGAAPLTLRVPIEVVRHEATPGSSRFQLRLPGPQLPVHEIEVTVAETTLLRAARVTEARFNGGVIAPTVLGHAELRRVQQGDAVAAALTIPITRPRETELELAVDDGNNPPLQLVSAMAVLAPLPWVYVEPATAGTLMARFGDSKARAPAYDLEARRAGVAPDLPSTAVWGERRALVADVAAATVPEAGALRGGPLATDGFQFVRAIDAVHAGLNALRVDLGVLAHSRSPDEWRVLDADGRQVPYVLEQRDEPLAVPLTLQRVDTVPDPARPGVSRYAIDLPYATLPAGHLVVHTPARVFQRLVRVVMDRVPPDPRRRSQEIEVARWVWNHADAGTAAPPLRLALPRLRETKRVILEIEEGDNSPLALEAPRFETAAYRVRFFAAADASSLRFAYGHATLPAPTYDLSLLTGVVMGRAAHEPRLAPEPSNGTDRGASTPTATMLFWGVLVLTTLGLAFLFVRLLRRGGMSQGSAGA